MKQTTIAALRKISDNLGKNEDIEISQKVESFQTKHEIIRRDLANKTCSRFDSAGNRKC